MHNMAISIYHKKHLIKADMLNGILFTKDIPYSQDQLISSQNSKISTNHLDGVKIIIMSLVIY